MKAYIFKDASGEYGSYEENIKNVYLVNESMPSISELEIKWNEFIKSEKKKAKESCVRWTKGYVKKNGFLFEDWFKKNYSCTLVNFEENINYE